MRYSDISTAVQTLFGETNQIVPFTIGKPGGGKSFLNREIAKALFAAHGEEMIEFNAADPRTWEVANYVEFNASLRDPVDIMGTPNNDGAVTDWKPPREIYCLRKGTKGIKVFNLEEVSDATVAMQNALCGVIYDRRAGQMQLSEKLYILASGNRTEDKSGANRLTSKFANRCVFFDFHENVDDWSQWALESGVDHRLVQFIRFRPNLLSDFDPNRRANPTPRTWAWVSKIPPKLPTEIYFGTIAGLVGDGAAAEYTGYLKVYMDLPDIEEIIMKPATTKVPKDPATLYALTGAVAHKLSKDNIDRVMEYVERMPAEFQVMCMKDALQLKPEIKGTKGFVKFAVKNSNLMI
jgi:hypothetical protein